MNDSMRFLLQCRVIDSYLTYIIVFHNFDKIHLLSKSLL
jgi:hypothetical protein